MGATEQIDADWEENVPQKENCVSHPVKICTGREYCYKFINFPPQVFLLKDEYDKILANLSFPARKGDCP
ncbi:MAG: hypothetical protein HDT18_06050 [Oscillibacter sp.]|nr:hypothetical protein [Oscillibacter sp.]